MSEVKHVLQPDITGHISTDSHSKFSISSQTD